MANNTKVEKVDEILVDLHSALLKLEELREELMNLDEEKARKIDGLIDASRIQIQKRILSNLPF